VRTTPDDRGDEAKADEPEKQHAFFVEQQICVQISNEFYSGAARAIADTQDAAGVTVDHHHGDDLGRVDRRCDEQMPYRVVVIGNGEGDGLIRPLRRAISRTRSRLIIGASAATLSGAAVAPSARSICSWKISGSPVRYR
jgi:hypothetical protein